jgi:hypothetical protein
MGEPTIENFRKENITEGGGSIEQTCPKSIEDDFISDFYLNMLKDQTGKADDRAKYMIVTCAALVVIHFGLLLNFTLESSWYMVIPEYLFLIALAFFAVSFQSIIRKIDINRSDVRQQFVILYLSVIKRKYVWQYLGFGFFVAGLAFISITIHATLAEKSQYIETICSFLGNLPQQQTSTTGETLSDGTLLHVQGDTFNTPPQRPPPKQPCL